MPRSARAAFVVVLGITLAAASPAAAQAPAPGWDVGPGWEVMPTSYGFDELVQRLDQAVKDHGMLLVTRASASQGAKSQRLTIPGNMVVGVFRNDFARRMLNASIPAGIEAPIRFYIAENPDGTATLSYIKPTTVFEPYVEGNEGLAALATELNAIFGRIAAQAAGGR